MCIKLSELQVSLELPEGMATWRATESAISNYKSNATICLDFEPVSLRGYISEQETHLISRGGNINTIHFQAIAMVNEYRCTRNQPYLNPKCFSYTNRLLHQSQDRAGRDHSDGPMLGQVATKCKLVAEAIWDNAFEDQQIILLASVTVLPSLVTLIIPSCDEGLLRMKIWAFEYQPTHKKKEL